MFGYFSLTAAKGQRQLEGSMMNMSRFMVQIRTTSRGAGGGDSDVLALSTKVAYGLLLVGIPAGLQLPYAGGGTH